MRDLRHAVRSLLRAPLFTGVALLSLALGIGANTSIFTLFDQVLLRLLPVREPRSLVQISTEGSYLGNTYGRNAISYPMYKDYRDRTEVFAGVICRRGETVNLSYGEWTERSNAELVSGNYFEVLGVGAALGRVFTAADETAPGANPVIVLNHEYWLERFDGDRSILGKVLRINGHPMAVVGVAAPGYNGLTLGSRPAVHIPVTMKRQVTPSWDELENRRSRWLNVFARLRPGVTVQQAEASTRLLYQQIIRAEVEEPAFRNAQPYSREQFLRSFAVLQPGGQGDSGMRRALDVPLKILMGLVGVVLLIACANTSNLLVARAEARRKEIAMRIALGAGRLRVVKELMLESLLLAFTAGCLGLLVSYWTTRALLLFAPDEQARLALSPTPDVRVLAFTFGVCAAAALVFGLVPALRVSSSDLASTLKQQAASVAGGHTRLRKLLVGLQVCLSLLLLIGSGLFVRSLQNLRSIDPGFSTNNVVRFKINPALSGYDGQRRMEFFRALEQQLRSVPGVEAAGLARIPILDGSRSTSTVTIEGYASKPGEDMNPLTNAVSPGYFAALNMRIISGRDFTEQDTPASGRVAIVNSAFARRYFGEKSPVGCKIAFGSGPTVRPDITIVGVVQDGKHGEVNEETARQLFTCSAQSEELSEMTGYVRTSMPPAHIFSAIRREVAQIDRTLPVYAMGTMEEQLERSLSIERFVAFLASTFGWLATILAACGLYGITAYSVARRAGEIGIRMALGAGPSRIVKLVLRETVLVAAGGVAVGLPLAWWVTKLVRNQLYGIDARDPFTVSIAVMALLVIAALAAALPAWRATRLQAGTLLRRS